MLNKKLSGILQFLNKKAPKNMRFKLDKDLNKLSCIINHGRKCIIVYLQMPRNVILHELFRVTNMKYLYRWLDLCTSINSMMEYTNLDYTVKLSYGFTGAIKIYSFSSKVDTYEPYSLRFREVRFIDLSNLNNICKELEKETSDIFNTSVNRHLTIPFTSFFYISANSAFRFSVGNFEFLSTLEDVYIVSKHNYITEIIADNVQNMFAVDKLVKSCTIKEFSREFTKMYSKLGIKCKVTGGVIAFTTENDQHKLRGHSSLRLQELKTTTRLSANISRNSHRRCIQRHKSSPTSVSYIASLAQSTVMCKIVEDVLSSGNINIIIDNLDSEFSIADILLDKHTGVFNILLETTNTDIDNWLGTPNNISLILNNNILDADKFIVKCNGTGEMKVESFIYKTSFYRVLSLYSCSREIYSLVKVYKDNEEVQLTEDTVNLCNTFGIQ